jgi:thiamine biosynthesis lipoprotein
MVEIGGEVRAHGVNAKGETWRIGINKPNNKGLYDDNDLEDVIHLKDKALATSGNYRNFYVKDGKRYAHTIDPHTGYPVQHSLLSSSVLANNCMTADAYATAFMVMGVEKAKKIVENDPNLEAYFIYAGDNNMNMVWYSKGFKNLIIK